MSSYTSSLIIKLLDQASAPARAISATLGRLQAAQQRNSAALAASQGAMLGAVGAGFALYQALTKPTAAAIAFETALEDIAQKVDVPISQLQELGKEVRAVAKATTLSAQEAAAGIDVLAGMGANREDAMELMKPIGKAATAYNAEVADLAQAGYAALDNLKVPANQFAAALDAMAQAGKAGAFELKDMARYFPTLGAGYQALGQTGVPAVADLSAALQIVRKGTGDSASAATNLSNILQKMQAPQTVKAFKKMGIDLEKELKQAAKNGMTPIEAIAEITNKALKGDMSKLGYLFADAQVQQGLRPLLQNIDEYRKIRKEAMEAQGVVEEDYQRRLKTGAVAVKRFSLAFENISLAIGNILLPVLADLADRFVPILNAIADFTQANPKLSRTIILATSAFVAFRVAATAARFALLWTKGGLLASALGGIGGLTRGVVLVSRAFKFLRIAMLGVAVQGLLSGMFTWLIATFSALISVIGSIVAGIGGVLAGISAPVWIIAAVIIGLAVIIYKYWQPLSRLFIDFAVACWNGIKFLGSLLAQLPGLIVSGLAWLGSLGLSLGKTLASACWNGIKFLGSLLAQLPGLILSALGQLGALGISLGKDLASACWDGLKMLGSFVVQLPSLIGNAIVNGASVLLDAGKQLMYSLWDGIKQVMSEIVYYIKTSISNAASSAVNSVRGYLPSWMGGTTNAETTAPAIEGARAAGGPVTRASTYLVGEMGPELFTPTTSGFIHSNADTVAHLNSLINMRIPTIAMAGAGQNTMSSSKQVSVNLGGVSINVQASPHMNVNDLANAVMRKLSSEVDALGRSAFSDGVY